MINRIVDSLFQLSIQRPRTTLTLLLLVAGSSLMLAKRLELRHDPADLLPDSGTSDSTLAAAVARLGNGPAALAIIVQPQQLPRQDRTAAVAPVLDRLADKLGDLPSVMRVDHRLPDELPTLTGSRLGRSAFLYLNPSEVAAIGERLTREQIQRTLSEVSGRDERRTGPVIVEDLLARDPLGVLTPLAGVAGKALGNPGLRLNEGYFELRDGSGYLILVHLAEPVPDAAAARNLVSGIDSILAEERQRHPAGSIEFTAVGRPYIVVEGFDVAMADGRRVALGAAAIVALALALFFGRLAAPLLLSLPVVTGLLVAAALAAVAFGAVSPVVWLFAAVLIGLGVDFGIHVLSHYWIAGEEHSDRATALHSAFSSPGTGIVIGAVTTAAAFSSLAIVSYPLIRHLALVTASGILAITVLTLVTLPLVLRWTSSGEATSSLWASLSRLAARVNISHGRRVVVLWLLLVLGGAAAAPVIPVETHPWNITLRSSEHAARLVSVTEMMGRSLAPVMAVSRGPTREEALALDRLAVQRLEVIAPRAGISFIESLSRWTPDPDSQESVLQYLSQHSDQFDRERIRSDFIRAARSAPTRDYGDYLANATAALPQDPTPVTVDSLEAWGLRPLTARHLTQVAGEWVAVSYLHLTDLPWAEGVMERLDETVARWGGPELSNLVLAGYARERSGHPATLRRDVIRASLLATAAVLLVLGLHFRRPVPVLLCLVPVVCGVATALGFMALAGIELNTLTLAVAPLIVGIGVDDGVHMVERLNRGEPREKVMRQTGAAMALTTATTVAAFGSLLLASFPGVAQAGLVGVVGLSAAFLSAVQLIPILHPLPGQPTGPRYRG